MRPAQPARQGRSPAARLAPRRPRSALSWGLAALSRRPQLGPAPGSGEDILSPARKTELAHVTPAVSVSR